MQNKRELSEEEIKQRNWMYQNLKKGMKIKGKITNIQSYGVFVDIGKGITGLLHIEDISIARIKTPDERFKKGQIIDVLIKNYDKDTGRIVLTHKELLRQLGR